MQFSKIATACGREDFVLVFCMFVCSGIHALLAHVFADPQLCGPNSHPNHPVFWRDLFTWIPLNLHGRSMESIGTQGIHAYPQQVLPWNPWVCMESTDTR
jgi:hypothetical protein